MPSVQKEPFYLSFQSDRFVMSLLLYKTICIIVVVLFRIPKNGVGEFTPTDFGLSSIWHEFSDNQYFRVTEIETLAINSCQKHPNTIGILSMTGLDSLPANTQMNFSSTLTLSHKTYSTP